MPKLSRLHQLFALIAVIGFLSAMCSNAHAAAPVAAYQQTASLETSQTARTYPGAPARVIAQVAATRPLTGSQTVLPVIGHARADGHAWLLVRLPHRPDGLVGWISADGVRLGETPWHVVVVRADRQATLYYRGRVARVFTVIVGKPSTPTPAGQFFVAEKLYEGYGLQTGPWALATSAYSNVLQEFDGGPGQLAMHGIVGLSDPMGTAASHGCVRFTDTDITWLAARIGAGTPITIL